MPRSQPPASSPDPIEFLVLPYDSARSRSLLHLLIEEFRGTWTRFQCAVAFISSSGNFPDLLGAIESFARRGNRVEMTFGADSFSRESRGSDYRAIETLMQKLGTLPSVKIHLYHEQRRTFHPKVYLFSNEAERRALLIVGSSNWSNGDLGDHVEAN